MKESYIRMNTFYLCVYTILYLTISMNLIKYNLGMAFLLYLIGFVILLVFLIIFSKIFMKMHMAKSDKQSSKRYGTFECTIDKDGILEILNGEESMTIVAKQFLSPAVIAKRHLNVVVVSSPTGIHPFVRERRFLQDPGKLCDKCIFPQGRA